MESRIKLEKLVKVILLCSIAVVAGFIIYQIIFNHPPPYINFGMLNESGEYGNYPNNVSVGEEIHLRYYIGNNHPGITEFSVRTFLANTTSTVSFTKGVDNATFIQAYNLTVNYNASYISDPLIFTINNLGNYYRICFELWVLNETRWNYLEYSVQYIWVNCTV